jgi:hypothetical protein
MTATLVWHPANIAVHGKVRWTPSVTPYACGNIDLIAKHLIPVSDWIRLLLWSIAVAMWFPNIWYWTRLCLHYVNVPMYQLRILKNIKKKKKKKIRILWYELYDPQLTRRSRGRELDQEGMCNRVPDRYEDKVAYTLAHAMRTRRCGCQLCKQHERSNMWYKRKLIKNTYSTTAYAGLTAMRDLPRFIVYHSEVMWPYYIE